MSPRAYQLGGRSPGPREPTSAKAGRPGWRAEGTRHRLHSVMPVFRLDDELAFPPPHLAEDNGLLAVGGDLRPERLLLAYSSGIFPWYEDGMPILWHSPDPRMVLDVDELRIGRTLAKVLRRDPYEIRCDTVFEQVITKCAEVPRPNQDGTWITDEMLDAYIELHRLGFAHSVEAWRDDALAGGLYGVSLGGAFFGESMFAQQSNASKVAFVALVRQLQRWNFALVDCQVHTELLESFGARLYPRRHYLSALEEALKHPTRRGYWQLDADVLATAD